MIDSRTRIANETRKSDLYIRKMIFFIERQRDRMATAFATAYDNQSLPESCCACDTLTASDLENNLDDIYSLNETNSGLPNSSDFVHGLVKRNQLALTATEEPVDKTSTMPIWHGWLESKNTSKNLKAETELFKKNTNHSKKILYPIGDSKPKIILSGQQNIITTSARTFRSEGALYPNLNSRQILILNW